MQKFSERMGYKEVKSTIQIESMDDDLRVSLWNVFYERVWENMKFTSTGAMDKKTPVYRYCHNLWTNFFKLPLHRIPLFSDDLLDLIQKFYSSAKWYEVYDFIEFTVNYYYLNLSDNFNVVLERELSGYRFVDKKLVQISSHEELETIEKSLRIKSKKHFASKHLSEALTLLADKESPDYRNSMKESITAVEAILVAITKEKGRKSTTLGQALNTIEKHTNIEIHPALKQSFEKMYGYTSDSGIRHFLKKDEQYNYEDAIFMLVVCSSFVNYLTEKSRKAGIELA